MLVLFFYLEVVDFVIRTRLYPEQMRMCAALKGTNRMHDRLAATRQVEEEKTLAVHLPSRTKDAQTSGVK